MLRISVVFSPFSSISSFHFKKSNDQFFIETSLQVLNLVQSYVTLRVPLYVSYVFHSPVAAGGWQHFDLQSELRLTFVYDTAILWKDGIGSPPQAELHGMSPRQKEYYSLCFCSCTGYSPHQQDQFLENSECIYVCVFFSRCFVSYEHAHQWAGTFGGKLPYQSSL